MKDLRVFFDIACVLALWYEAKVKKGDACEREGFGNYSVLSFGTYDSFCG